MTAAIAPKRAVSEVPASSPFGKQESHIMPKHDGVIVEIPAGTEGLEPP